MKLKCKVCGNASRFRATQAVSGSITVIVDESGQFMENTGPVLLSGDNAVDADSLNFGDPEEPYECAECDSTDIDVENDAEESDGDVSR